MTAGRCTRHYVYPETDKLPLSEPKPDGSSNVVRIAGRENAAKSLATER